MVSDVFRAFSQRDNPTGLGAIVAARLHPLESLPVTPDAIFVAASDVGDPGNVGTILRTMDGMGAAGLVLVGQTTDPFHPTAVKASMGTLFNIPVAAVERMDALGEWAEQHDLFTIATSGRAPRDYRDRHLFPALLLGAKRKGYPRTSSFAPTGLSLFHGRHGLPLNLAVAAGRLYELRRQQS